MPPFIWYPCDGLHGECLGPYPPKLILSYAEWRLPPVDIPLDPNDDGGTEARGTLHWYGDGGVRSRCCKQPPDVPFPRPGDEEDIAPIGCEYEDIDDIVL